MLLDFIVTRVKLYNRTAQTGHIVSSECCYGALMQIQPHSRSGCRIHLRGM